MLHTVIKKIYLNSLRRYLVNVQRKRKNDQCCAGLLLFPATMKCDSKLSACLNQAEFHIKMDMSSFQNKTDVYMVSKR